MSVPITERSRRGWILALLVVLAVAAIAFWLGRSTSLASKARTALDGGDLHKAARLVEEGLVKTPNDPALLVVKGRVLAEQHEWSAAAAVFGLAESSVERPEDHRAWATALVELERWDGAIEILSRLTKLTPNDPSVWNDLTVCRLQLGDWENALKSARSLVRIPSGKLRGHLRLAETHQRIEEYLESTEHFEKVLSGLAANESSVEAESISRVEVLLSLGEMLLLDGRAMKACKVFEDYMEHADGETDEAIHGTYLYGESLAETLQDDRAKIQWRAVLEQRPRHLKARLGLAQLELQAGRSQEAVDWLTPLATWSEVPADVAFMLLRAYTALDDEELSSEWAEKYAYLRQWEHLRRKIDSTQSRRQSYWEQVLYCHRLAFDKEWKQAEQIAQRLARTFPAEFVIEILDAIGREAMGREAKLPPLNNLAEEI